MMTRSRWGRIGIPVLWILSGLGCQPGGGPGEDAMTVPAETPTFLEGPAGRIRVDDGGTGGLPVLFVHGNGGNRTQWSAQLEHLRPGRRAVAIDLRGHGESAPDPGKDYSVPGFAADVGAAADSLGLDRFHLVGHSFGGAVAVAFAGRNPHRVAGLLLVDPAGDLSRVPRDSLQGWLELLRSETYESHTREWFEQILVGAAEGVPERVFGSLRSTPREVFVGAIRALPEFEAAAALNAYPGPKLTVITPINDEPYSLQNLVEDLPHEMVTGVSHWLMMDRPAEFNRTMDSFLARVESKGG